MVSGPCAVLRETTYVGRSALDVLRLVRRRNAVPQRFDERLQSGAMGMFRRVAPGNGLSDGCSVSGQWRDGHSLCPPSRRIIARAGCPRRDGHGSVGALRLPRLLPLCHFPVGILAPLCCNTIAMPGPHGGAVAVGEEGVQTCPPLAEGFLPPPRGLRGMCPRPSITYLGWAGGSHHAHVTLPTLRPRNQ